MKRSKYRERRGKSVPATPTTILADPSDEEKKRREKAIQQYSLQKAITENRNYTGYI